jgi:hypothetical protein
VSRWALTLRVVLEDSDDRASVQWEARRLVDAMRRSRAKRRGGTEHEQYYVERIHRERPRRAR